MTGCEVVRTISLKRVCAWFLAKFLFSESPMPLITPLVFARLGSGRGAFDVAGLFWTRRDSVGVSAVVATVAADGAGADGMGLHITHRTSVAAERCKRCVRCGAVRCGAARYGRKVERAEDMGCARTLHRRRHWSHPERPLQSGTVCTTRKMLPIHRPREL